MTSLSNGWKRAREIIRVQQTISTHTHILDRYERDLAALRRFRDYLKSRPECHHAQISRLEGELVMIGARAEERRLEIRSATSTLIALKQARESTNH